MNIKLFHDTLKLINECFPKGKKITKDEFLYFLLGYTHADKETENDKYLLTIADALGNCLAGKDMLRNVLGNHYSNTLSKSHNLTLKNLIKINSDRDPKILRSAEALLLSMQNELLDLCSKYSLPHTDTDNAGQLLNKLFTACITEKKYPCIFASQKKQQLKPATIKETVGRSDDSKNLLYCLTQYHKIIISGQPGSGKSRFVQYCQSTWGIQDYCCVSYNSNLETTKENILFYKNGDTSASLDDLRDESYSSSLLVIDHMNDSQNLSKELNELASYAINIIIVTTTALSSDEFHAFTLSPLSDDTLQSIFETSSGISLKDEDRDLLFQVSQKNVLLISLIAGQYKQIAKQSPEHSIILHQLLSSLDNTLSVHLPSTGNYTYTYKHQHDKKALDLLGHIKSIYANFAAKYKETNPLRRTMRFLCCFGYSVIPLSFLKLFSEYDQNAIDALSDMGWILKTDSTIQLPSLIARSAFACEIPSVTDCFEVIDKMADFLKDYDQTLSIPCLSNILFVFVCSINAKVKAKNNPGQKRVSAKFENWQDLIYSIYYYYLENGNFQLAEKITQMIYYPNMSHKHNKLDPSFFRLNIHMSLQDWIEKIPEEVDKLAALIENDETLLYASTAPFLITSMDNAIYLYCSCFFAYYNGIYTGNVDKLNIEDLKSYRFTLFNTIGKILHDLPNPKYNGNTKISLPQYEYYQLCHTLMSSPECISSHLFEPLIQESTITSSVSVDLVSQLCSETNANYRIRSIAFTMFMRSIYRKDLQFRLSASEYLTAPVNLIFTIRCDISKLYEQITDCEHIPWHTTWICLFCYLQLMAELSALYRKSNRSITMAYYSYMLRSLLDRSTFSEDELNEAYEKITQYFSL